MQTYLRDSMLSELQRISPSLLLSQSRLSLPIHQVTLERLNCFQRQWIGLAIFSLACPTLAVDHSPRFKHWWITYCRYTLQLKQHKAQHSYYTCTRSCSFLYFTLVSWRGLLGPNPFVGLRQVGYKAVVPEKIFGLRGNKQPPSTRP